MRNTRLTNILLIVVLIFNVAFLSAWWISHRKMHHQKKEDGAEPTFAMNDRSKGGMFLVKTLGLDTIQQKKLDNILAAHYSFLDKYMDSYVRNQTNFFSALKDNMDSATAFHCADSMGVLKAAMEKELYLHFRSIKNICTPGQQKQYNELMDNMAKDFLHHHNALYNIKAKHDSL